MPQVHSQKQFFKLKALEYIALAGFGLTIIVYFFDKHSVNFALNIGRIWSVVLGLWMGSFATSIIARLPKNLPFKNSSPYCALCKKPLEARDLVTIFSYLWNKASCRFCQNPIPLKVFTTEIIITVIYVLTFEKYNFCDQYIMVTSFYSLLAMLIIMQISDHYFSKDIYYIAFIIACVRQAYFKMDIYTLLINYVIGWIIGMIFVYLYQLIEFKNKNLLNRYELNLPKLFALLSIWLNIIG